jgi:hypothetical protein
VQTVSWKSLNQLSIQLKVMNKAPTLRLVGFLAIAIIIAFSFETVAADANFFTQTTTFNLGTITNAKAAYLNGYRYVFTGTGWGGFGVSTIKVYTANSQWQQQTLIATSSFSDVQDFYVTTFPEVYPNYVIVAGVRKSTSQYLFVSAFDTTTNKFVNTATSTKDGYCTGIYYAGDFNEFVITTFGFSSTGWLAHRQILTATPQTLFTPSSWVPHQYAIPDGKIIEARATYFSKDKSTYIQYVSSAMANHGLIVRWDMTANTFTNVFDDGFASSWPYVGQYISNNGAALFQTFMDGNYWHYYRSDNGYTWTEFTTLPKVNPVSPGLETHGNVLALQNGLVLCGTVADNNPDGYYALFDPSTGNALETYTVNSHTTAFNQIVYDGCSYAISGEGMNGVTGVHLTVLTPVGITPSPTPTPTNTPTPSPTPSPTPTPTQTPTPTPTSPPHPTPKPKPHSG